MDLARPLPPRRRHGDETCNLVRAEEQSTTDPRRPQASLLDPTANRVRADAKCPRDLYQGDELCQGGLHHPFLLAHSACIASADTRSLAVVLLGGVPSHGGL